MTTPHKPHTGLKIHPPQPPEAKAFGQDYEAYLQVYDKYVERMQEIRKNLSRSKPLKSRPGKEGPIVVTPSGVKVELVKSAVWTACSNLRTATSVIRDTLNVVEDLKPIASEKFAAVAQRAPHSATAAGPSKPVTPVKKTRGKRANKSIRDELRAARAAATLASTLSTAQKDAARAGAKVVRDQGGWNIVVKGAPDATRKGDVAWRRRVAKRFVTKKAALLAEIAGAVRQFPQTSGAQALVTLEQVFDVIKKNGIELAY